MYSCKHWSFQLCFRRISDCSTFLVGLRVLLIKPIEFECTDFIFHYFIYTDCTLQVGNKKNDTEMQRYVRQNFELQLYLFQEMIKAMNYYLDLSVQYGPNLSNLDENNIADILLT